MAENEILNNEFILQISKLTCKHNNLEKKDKWIWYKMEASEEGNGS